MDRIELSATKSKTDVEYRVEPRDVAVIRINGRDLVDMVREVEQPSQTAKGIWRGPDSTRGCRSRRSTSHRGFYSANTRITRTSFASTRTRSSCTVAEAAVNTDAGRSWCE